MEGRVYLGEKRINKASEPVGTDVILTLRASDNDYVSRGALKLEKAVRVFNADLAEIYAKYHAKGLEIYQVSLDIDKPSWAAVVKGQNLPWISVNDGLGTQSPAVIAYNVDHVPTMFVIDRTGDFAGRDVFDETALDQLVRKLL